MQVQWWKKAVAYQVYPRSFSDSNNDGLGDLRRIIRHLDYLHRLGIRLLWLSPVYKSPMDDNGYDISDYQDIDPIFGNLDDMTELIEKSRAYGIRIMMDLVVNHCSDEHPWFQKALADPDCEEASYFILNRTAASLQTGDQTSEAPCGKKQHSIDITCIPSAPDSLTLIGKIPVSGKRYTP